MKQFRDLKNLLEATEESDDFKYFTKAGKEIKEINDQVTKVMLELKAQKASAATKLISQYAEVLKEKKKIDDEITKLKDQCFPMFEKLFLARDAVYTRVIDTASLTLTMSKETTKTTEKFDIDKFFEEVSKEVVPEVFNLLKEIQKKVTEVKTSKVCSTLTPKLKEDLSSLINSLVRLWTMVTSKLKKVDQVLAKWKKLV